MREILFRGKRNDNGKWIKGFYCQVADESDGGTRIKQTILVPTFLCQSGFKQLEVDSETVGQFTGLTDKNGKKIFEGDILKAIHYFRGSIDEFKKKKIRKAYGKAIENKNSYLEEFTYFRNYVVEYSAKKCAWIGRNGSDQHELKSLTNCFHKGEVIGNVHDNPELLGGVD